MVQTVVKGVVCVGSMHGTLAVNCNIGAHMRIDRTFPGALLHTVLIDLFGRVPRC